MTTHDAGTSLRDDLRAAVRRAMRERNRTALAVFRSALAAIDNAEAVPMNPAKHAGAMELSPGLGRTEVRRHLLSEQDVIDVVRREVLERRDAAAGLAGANADAARQLCGEADVLESMVDVAASRVVE